MTKIIFALGLTLAASTSAFAASSALDVQDAPSAVAGQSMVDYTATAAIGTETEGNKFAVSPRAL
ncbi:hypothetical protein DFR52_102868 [Hoeflea marina]|uniref:Uncharacterized protein n=1 Tax=Hoeflea marina TaxID=274592 RepID=A0A317PRL3_9HYPH|nr:hypothetical protein [Hoeflea marina]PWW02200.1 hypothetical protein DFR52_102868 [Hoeflea marina]